MIEGKQLKVLKAFLSEVQSVAQTLIVLAVALVLLPRLPWGEWTTGAVLVLIVHAVVFLALGIRFYAFRRTLERYTITVDATRMASSAPQPGGMSLSWSELTGVKDRPFSKQLEVHGPPGSPPVILPYQLEDFAELVRFLTEQLPAPAVPPLPMTFRKDYSLLLFGLFVVIPLSTFGGSSLRDIGEFGDTLNAILVGFLLGVLSLYHHRSAIKRLLIDATGFHLHELLSKVDFGFHEVEAVTLIPKEGSAQSNQQLRGPIERLDVIAHLTGGREYSILPAGCDAFAVYRTFQASWQQYKTRQVVTREA